MCLRLCVCVYMCGVPMHVYTYVCMYMESEISIESVLSVFLYSSSPDILKQSLVESGAHEFH